MMTRGKRGGGAVGATERDVPDSPASSLQRLRVSFNGAQLNYRALPCRITPLREFHEDKPRAAAGGDTDKGCVLFVH